MVRNLATEIMVLGNRLEQEAMVLRLPEAINTLSDLSEQIANMLLQLASIGEEQARKGRSPTLHLVSVGVAAEAIMNRAKKTADVIAAIHADLQKSLSGEAVAPPAEPVAPKPNPFKPGAKR